jgi:hypothetical protein
MHEGDKDAKNAVVVVRSDVKKIEEALGQSPDIFVAHGKDTESGESDDDSFRELKGGDGAYAFDVSGIVEFRVHLMKINFEIERAIADSF